MLLNINFFIYDKMKTILKNTEKLLEIKYFQFL